MANPLASSISKGKGSGEAAFLGESSFDPVKFTEGLVKQEQTQRLADQKQGELDMKSLLDDDFKANWDIDALNTFQPRIDEFRSGVLETFSAQKGRLTPAQKIELNAKKKRLQEDILLSNKAYEAYNQNVQGLKSAILKGGGEIDVAESEKRLAAYKDPMSVPELASEIQSKYGGSVTKWRMDNALNYGLVPSFSFDKYTDEIMKGENLSELPIQDEKGNVLTEKLPGGDYLYRVEKKLSPEQSSALANRVWSETNPKSDKAKNMAYSAVDESFTIDNSGNVSFAIGGAITEADGDKILEYAGKLDGLSTDEIRRRLAKGYLAATFESKSDKGVMTRKSRGLPQGRGGRYGSGGGGWDSKFSISVTEEPEIKESEVKKTLGVEGFPTAPGQLSYSAPNKEKGDKYVSITRLKPSGTAEEEAMTLLNGKPIKVIGFKVTGDGKVLMDYAYKSNIQDFQSGKKEVNLIEKGYDIAKDAKLLASISSSFGTEDKQFNKEDFLNFLREKAGITKQPKTKTEAKAQASKSKKSLSLATIRSKVGTKGFEGYTEKELVDYYKSQGYNVK